MADNKSKVEKFFGGYPLTRYGKGQVIMRPDETIQKVLYIQEGTISQYDITPAGNEVVLNIFKPGAFMPMSNVLNNVPNRYFFSALAPVAARLVPADHVIKFLKEEPDILLDLLKRVYLGTDGIILRMAHLMGGTAKSRLLFEILNSIYRFGDKQANGAAYLKISENDLAKQSGLTRETVNRTIRDLKKDGLLIVHRNALEIPNLAKIEELVGVDL
jgi:CRP-like cAMP-binding protein